VLLDEVVEIIEDLPLAFRQWQHGRNYTQTKGESQRAAVELDSFAFPTTARW
jgi:hypothetical protein